MFRPDRLILGSLLVAALVVSGYFAYEHFRSPAEVAQPGKPVLDPVTGRAIDPATGKPVGRLVVLVAIDQLRGDYLARWADHFGPGGFERLKKAGVWYSDAHIPYSCTSTGPGHASLVTGAQPAVHGIIENEWFDRKTGAKVYCCEPTGRPFDRVPPQRAKPGEPTRGTSLGFSPERLLAETVADRLKETTADRARVVSLSIKDRSAVLMAGQKPDAVYCFDNRDGLFHTGAFYREEVHPWVAEFNQSKRVNNWFSEKWERVRPSLDYKLATGSTDEAAGEAFGFNGQGRLFPHPFAGKLTTPAKGYYEALECSPAGNDLLFELAKKAITAEKLGQGETADLLCVSLSSNDLVGHQWGPDSWEVLDMTLRTDARIAELLSFLDSTLGPDRYTVVVSSDHGICPIPEQEKLPGARRLSVNDIFKPLIIALNTTYGIAPSGPTQWFEPNEAKDQDRLWPWIYLNRRAIEARGLTVDEVARYVRDWLAGRDFFETALTPQQLETETFPATSFGAMAQRAFRRERCGDVIAIPKAGVLVTGYSNGTSHGSPQSYDTHIPVLAMGASIPALGEQRSRVSSLIVAPILANALGITPPRDGVEPLPQELK